ADTLNALAQHIVSKAECLGKRHFFVDDLQEPVIGYGDQGIDMLLKVGNALLRSGTTLIALKGEWLCNDTDCQRSDLARNLCHYRASACSCTTTHTSRHEYHVSALERLIQLFSILFRRLGPNTGIATRTEATGKLIPYADMVCSLCEDRKSVV